jgi:tRNA pseudouridine32 synthase / 23S rRNA pseudouridine746 synthase
MTRNKPVRDGVRASEVVLTRRDGETVFAALCARFLNIDAAQWSQRFASNAILDINGAPISTDVPVSDGLHVFYFRNVEAELPIAGEARIVFQDDELLVADKPHFLPVSPVGAYVQETLLTRLITRTGIAALSPLHRLDKDTAGLVLFSVNPSTRGSYQALFRERRIHKVYEAIAAKLPALQFPLTIENRLENDPSHFMKMHVVEGIPNAKTVVEIVKRFESFAWYRLRPETGQRHQLRVHMAHLGAAILNDPIYPTLRERPERTHADAPLQLLAKSLEFIDPLSGALRSFESTFQLQI